MNVRYSAIAAILLCAAVHGETHAPPASSLDAARRDLRELPATERSQESLGKSSGFGTASLPALALPSSGDPAQNNKPEPNAAPSPTWLLDALQQTDAERGQRRPAADTTLTRDQGKGYKSASAPDPLAQYLGQWIDPRDRELLRTDVSKTADQRTKSPLDQASMKSEMSGSSALQAGATPFLINEPAKNPYLQEPAPQPSQLNPFAPTSVTSLQSQERSQVPSAFPVATGPANLSSTPTSVKSAVKPLEPVSAPPTAPIVDDRKYFPQLRRF